MYESKLENKIDILRKQGQTYEVIAHILKCSKSVVQYHCNPHTKKTMQLNCKKRRKNCHPYEIKLQSFNRVVDVKNVNKSNYRIISNKIQDFFKNRSSDMRKKRTFTTMDVINKFGDNPKCYLTGKEIDIKDTESYHFDHIIPVSKGGLNTLDNLEIATKNANIAKSNLSITELEELCKSILIHRGYKINKE